MILTQPRDKRLITIRRGGTLTDSHHHLLALWSAECASHVLHFFEKEQPKDHRPRTAISLAKAWAKGKVSMAEARNSAGHANASARNLKGAARFAAYAAAQAAAVAHVAAHELGAAAYAIKAVQAASIDSERVRAGHAECEWQRSLLPNEIRDLVLDDQKLRNEACWNVFDFKKS